MRLGVGVALGKVQRPQWWGPLVNTAYQLARDEVFDGIDWYFVGSAMTDFNRNEIVHKFLKTDATHLWFIDDDTVPTTDAVTRLLQLDTDVANGVYYQRTGTHHPVAYGRDASGLYQHLSNFVRGEIFEPESVGMGNTLIKRTVFDTIMDQYSVYRHTIKRTLYPVHKDDVTSQPYENVTVPKYIHERAPMVIQGPADRGYLVWPVEGPVDFSVEANKDVKWPFFGMEAGRTEDHWFNEMVLRCGLKVLVDTWNEAEHIGYTTFNSSDWRSQKKQQVRLQQIQEALGGVQG